MNLGRQIVSLLLLFLFGVNLLVEAGSFHSNETGDHIAKASLCQAADYADENRTEPSHCADPCHTGRCHFGHCPYFAAKSHPEMSPNFSSQVRLAQELAIPISAFLKGIKRPPRYS